MLQKFSKIDKIFFSALENCNKWAWFENRKFIYSLDLNFSLWSQDSFKTFKVYWGPKELLLLWIIFINIYYVRPFRYDLNQIPYDYTVEVRSRFKGLDLIDRVPDELWMEIRDKVQETGIKTIPKKNKCRKAKWLSEEALQIAVKKRQAKSKGEKERYKHLNAVFQRIARDNKRQGQLFFPSLVKNSLV